jgi:hypothetical protein
VTKKQICSHNLNVISYPIQQSISQFFLNEKCLHVVFDFKEHLFLS